MAKIHPLADVQSTSIGSETTVWQFSIILKNAQIGNECNICAHTFIENDVTIGDRVTVKTGVQIWDGITIEDDVFIGPNVTFTNDLVPRSKHYPETFSKTLIKKGASIGANATIVAGNTIGEYSLIGAGSVVTKEVPPHSVFYGNPATLKGYVTKEGLLLNLQFKAENGKEYIYDNGQLKLND